MSHTGYLFVSNARGKNRNLLQVKYNLSKKLGIVSVLILKLAFWILVHVWHSLGIKLHSIYMDLTCLTQRQFYVVF